MAEIKEQRSAFNAIDKDVVGDWLGHPCTMSLRFQLDVAIEEAKSTAIDIISYPGPVNDQFAHKVRDAGAVIVTLQRVLYVFEEAARHANS